MYLIWYRFWIHFSCILTVEVIKSVVVSYPNHSLIRYMLCLPSQRNRHFILSEHKHASQNSLDALASTLYSGRAEQAILHLSIYFFQHNTDTFWHFIYLFFRLFHCGLPQSLSLHPPPHHHMYIETSKYKKRIYKFITWFHQLILINRFQQI